MLVVKHVIIFRVTIGGSYHYQSNHASAQVGITYYELLVIEYLYGKSGLNHG